MDPQARLLDAIRAKHAGRVRAAIAGGARLNLVDGQKSALHAAAEGGNVEVLKALPAASARRLINSLDGSDRTPLMCTAQRSHLEAARMLLELGADVNARNSLGDTALRTAAAEGSPEMARLLLEAGADPNIPGRLLLTAMDRARERRTPEGRMITALFTRAAEAKVGRKAARSRKGRRSTPKRKVSGRRRAKSKQLRRRR